jgi:large subunit ribosomal protein L5
MAKKSKTAEGDAPQVEAVPPRLREQYFKEILPALAKKLGRKNIHALPRLEKIVVNMGVGSAITEKKHIEDAAAALAQITGQKALVTKSRKAIPSAPRSRFAARGCTSSLTA